MRLAILPLLAILASAQPLAAQEAPRGDRVTGRQAYLKNGCQNCHGSVGQGGGPGPVLADTQLPYEAYVAQMRTPSNIMPAYSGLLMTDRELADVFAYLRALPGPRAERDMPAILRPR